MGDGGAPDRFVGRRQFLQGAGALGLLAFVPPVRFGRLMAAAPAPGAAGRFLTGPELDTLRALCRPLIPGPPHPPDPRAGEALRAGAIDLLLRGFQVPPPLVPPAGPPSAR